MADGENVQLTPLQQYGAACVTTMMARLKVPGNKVAEGWEAAAPITPESTSTQMVYWHAFDNGTIGLGRIFYGEYQGETSTNYGWVKRHSRTVLVATDRDDKVIGLIDSGVDDRVVALHTAIAAGYERGAEPGRKPLLDELGGL